MSIKIKQQTELRTLPVLALRGLVLFPGMILQFDAGRKKSILALSEAMENDQTILLVAQKDLEDNDPSMDQLYKVGVIACSTPKTGSVFSRRGCNAPKSGKRSPKPRSSRRRFVSWSPAPCALPVNPRL